MKTKLPKEIENEIKILLDRGLYDRAKRMYDSWQEDLKIKHKVH